MGKLVIMYMLLLLRQFIMIYNDEINDLKNVWFYGKVISGDIWDCEKSRSY